MSSHYVLIGLASVVGTVLLGALFFFALIGVFGLRSAIGGLLIFLIAVVTITCEYPSKVQNHEP
jgi:hypothetical protein